MCVWLVPSFLTNVFPILERCIHTVFSWLYLLYWKTLYAHIAFLLVAGTRRAPRLAERRVPLPRRQRLRRRCRLLLRGRKLLRRATGHDNLRRSRAPLAVAAARRLCSTQPLARVRTRRRATARRRRRWPGRPARSCSMARTRCMMAQCCQRAQTSSEQYALRCRSHAPHRDRDRQLAEE